jgi:Ca2+-binding RTX toxin-like protein
MTTFYVSTTGSDSANGLGLNTAFATLQRAQQAMRQAGGDDTTLVAGGRYDLRDGLQLTAADNGSSFQGIGINLPVLSGGTTLTNWTKGANGIWTAPLAEADLHQLTLDSVRQTEARFPNTVPDDPVEGGWLWANDPPAGIDPRQQMAFDPGDVTAAQLAVGMKVHLFTNASWSSSTLTVTAVDRASGVVSFDNPADFDLGGATRYYIEDGRVHLDQPGEWFFDPTTQLVHYKAPAGFDGTGVVASGETTIIQVAGAQDITISGFTFADAATAAYNGDFGEAGISVVGSTGITITGNQFVNLAQGVSIVQGSSDITVSDNDFAHLWSSAIRADYGTSNNTITGNDIRWTGEVFVFQGAIALPESLNNLVAHNLIRDVPRFGINGGNYDGANLSGGNVIEYNTILRSMQQTSDGGAIYTWSGPDKAHRGDIVRYNRIIDAGGLETEQGGFRPEQEYSNGIYLDDFTSRWQVYGNMIEGSVRGGIYLHGGSFNSVHDNIVLGNKDIGIQFFEIGERMVGNDVYRNIVEATTDPNGNTVELNPAFVAPGTVHDNFYWNPRGQTLNFSGQSFTEWQAAGYDTNSDIFTDGGLFPGELFVGPNGGDWRLVFGSLPLTQGFVELPLPAMAAFGNGEIILGTDGEDTLGGGLGDNIVEGFGGKDVLQGSRGDDQLLGGAGTDTIRGEWGADSLFGGLGRDFLDGGFDNDQLYGDADLDRLFGEDGNDTLWGGTGNDILNGGLGADVLFGGFGADTFYFNRPSETGLTPTTRDRIEDFEDGVDKISVSVMDANSIRSGNQVFRLSQNTQHDGQAGSLRIVTLNGDTFVMADLNGDRISDFTIQLEGIHQLTANDFFL